MTVPRFDLIETIAFDPELGLKLLDLHIARLSASSDALGFRFDRHALRNDLQAVTFSLAEPARVRVLLGPAGETAIEVGALRTWPEPFVPVSLQPRNAPADDVRVRHKTTSRALYETALKAGGTCEVLLVDEEGFLTEGCFSNIFLRRGYTLLTPPLSRGLLPGILRRSLLESGEAVEQDIRPEEIGTGLFVGNATRGLAPARLVAPGG